MSKLLSNKVCFPLRKLTVMKKRRTEEKRVGERTAGRPLSWEKHLLFINTAKIKCFEDTDDQDSSRNDCNYGHGVTFPLYKTSPDLLHVEAHSSLSPAINKQVREKLFFQLSCLFI